MRVYRWDLDKTYLQTDFHSVRGLVRSAVEPARDKRAVPGAPELLRELARERPGWRPRIFVLSGSPTQMRTVLEEKLRMDGVRVDEFILKDNLANLKRGRLRAVRSQLGYKLPLLLRSRVGLGAAVRESLFGDDAEVDALVYSIYADAIAGRIGPSELSRVMAAGGAYPDHIVEALASLQKLALADAVDRIFIRLDRGRPLADFAPFGSRVVPVASWFEAALVLYSAGELEADAVDRVRGSVGGSFADIVAWFGGVLERGVADPDRMKRLLTEVKPDATWAACEERLRAGVWPYAAPRAPEGVDWLEVLRSFGRG